MLITVSDGSYSIRTDIKTECEGFRRTVIGMYTTDAIRNESNPSHSLFMASVGYRNSHDS